MGPTFLVPVLNHGQITSRKTLGVWDTQGNKLASTRTGGWGKDWQLRPCWHSVVSFTLSLLTSFEHCSAAKNMWKFQTMRALQQGQTHAQSQTWCWALGITAHWHGAICQPLTWLGTLPTMGPVGIPSAQDQLLWRQQNQTPYWTITPPWPYSFQEFISWIRKSEESSLNLCGLGGGGGRAEIHFWPFTCTHLPFAFLL